MLPKNMRVHTPLFSSILEKGQIRSTQHFSLRFTQNKAKQSRFSVVVSKKVAKTAVKRNLLKRQISEIIKVLLPNFSKTPISSLIFAKKGSETLPFSSLKAEIQELFKKAGLLLE
jgi:ribonuclease P protein component